MSEKSFRILMGSFFLIAQISVLAVVLYFEVQGALNKQEATIVLQMLCPVFAGYITGLIQIIKKEPGNSQRVKLSVGPIIFVVVLLIIIFSMLLILFGLFGGGFMDFNSFTAWITMVQTALGGCLAALLAPFAKEEN